MKPNPTIHTRQNCQGTTLIEVLITAIVIAIGLLGVAALQVTALQGASNADYRSKAIDLATALSDRMHANLYGVTREEPDDGVANNYYLSDVDCDGVVCAMSPQMSDTDDVETCSFEQMANFDLKEISCGTGPLASLPGGQLNVRCIDNDTTDTDPCTALSPMLITVSWHLQGEKDANDQEPTDKVVMAVVPGAP